MNSVLVLDIETAFAILKKGEQPEINPATGQSYEYVTSFDDHDNAPAVTGIWDCAAGVKPVRFFFQEQLPELAKLIEQRSFVVTFNGDSFDLPKLARADLEIPKWKSLDLAVILRAASGEYVSLDALAEANLGTKKSGNGADAPKMWQRYKADPIKYQSDLWELIDYCAGDCWITWRLLMRAVRDGELMHPKLGRKVRVELPEGFGK